MAKYIGALIMEAVYGIFYGARLVSPIFDTYELAMAHARRRGFTKFTNNLLRMDYSIKIITTVDTDAIYKNPNTKTKKQAGLN